MAAASGSWSELGILMVTWVQLGLARLSVEAVEQGRQRDVDVLVGIAHFEHPADFAAGRALVLEHADDRKPLVADFDPAAQGIVKKEQRPLGVCAQYADALGGFQVLGGKKYPAAHAGVEHGQIVGGRAHHHGAEGVILGLGFDFEFALGGDVVGQKADAGNRPRIVPSQARRAILVGFGLFVGFFFPVLDDDIANAHLTDLFEGFLLGTLADGPAWQ